MIKTDKLKIYNSLTRKKEIFEPLQSSKVGIYICGPTVYDYIHIGNMRSFVAFDVIIRYLRYLGYDVKHVQNVTDVDDKMIKRAQKEGTTIKEIAKKYEKIYFDDMKAYNNQLPDINPRATEHIADIISLIKKIVENGYGYVKGGNVYFSIAKFKDYGKLSGVSINQLKAGARVEQDNYDKEHPRDFALWKASKPGEPSWDSPWGNGRPGWHIECSAMSMKYLGETFDIHGGGKDLKFPHHENEIAQSESATGKQFVRYWIHTEFLNIKGEKMAKSLGNFFTAHELLKQNGGKYDAKDLRYFLVSTHYRKPIDFKEEAIEDAKNSRKKLENMVNSVKHALEYEKNTLPVDRELESKIKNLKEKFEAAMNDDFNTPEALRVLFEFSSLLNKYIESPKSGASLKNALTTFLNLSQNVLGLQFESEKTEIPKDVKKLVEEREKARKEKDWNKADKIRDEIRKKGYIIEDKNDKSIVKPV
ncbi:MAG: cysteine--tRNA ligase [Candidatus Aenigmarchaeota archaeon]|nr:cysteine--tRNA ligase [Candidatus Aenigmarchaeota archaeon]